VTAPVDPPPPRDDLRPSSSPVFRGWGGAAARVPACRSRAFGLLGTSILILATASGTAGCNKDDESDTTGAGGEATAGGENPAGGSGGGGADGLVEAPDGSRGPGGSWDGDQPGGGGGGDGATAGHGGESGDASQGPTFDDLFGPPEGSEGAPLPNRPAMSGGARNAYQRGVQAARNGDLDAAEQAFSRALRDDGRAYQAAFALGVIADRKNDENRALQYYRRALQVVPDHERSAEGIVTIYLRRGSVPDALAFIEPLAQRWVRNLHLQALHAEVLARAGRFDDALEAARVALKRDERFVPAMIAMAKASLAQERTELAESVIEQALAVDPDNAELHFLNGQLLVDKPGRLAAALEAFQKAVTERPDYPEARTALGLLYLEGGNYSGALEQLEAAARLAPMLAEAHLNLGDAYRVNRRWAEAKASYERALAMRSELPAAHFNMGLMYMDAGEEFPEINKLTALQRAEEQFTRYRNLLGPRARRDDPATEYLEDLARLIRREETRMARERARAEREAERAARGADGSGDGG